MQTGCVHLFGAVFTGTFLCVVESAQILRSYQLTRLPRQLDCRGFKSEFLQICLRNAGMWIFLNPLQCQSVAFEKKEAVALARVVLGNLATDAAAVEVLFYFLVTKD